ncbi:MAG: hypothetical protein H3C45_04305 [Bacteroidia bacterium]|nr:hypothetical protein [Bacteroidia bacterium]
MEDIIGFVNTSALQNLANEMKRKEAEKKLKEAIAKVMPVTTQPIAKQIKAATVMPVTTQPIAKQIKPVVVQPVATQLTAKAIVPQTLVPQVIPLNQQKVQEPTQSYVIPNPIVKNETPGFVVTPPTVAPVTPKFSVQLPDNTPVIDLPKPKPNPIEKGSDNLLYYGIGAALLLFFILKK